MKCPVCKTDTLASIALAGELPAAQCANCHGNWIQSNAYMAWLRAKASDLPEIRITQPFNPVWEVHDLKICPNCKHMLRRFKIFPDTDFYLDRCGNCNGIWFDAHEWDALTDRNLHDNLHEFFTRPWQDQVLKEETRARMESIYLLKLGAQDYEKIKEFRAWLDGHEQKSMLIAFLLADDPYKV
jgi:Zn-finger nucleic acid-binding protein